MERAQTIAKKIATITDLYDDRVLPRATFEDIQRELWEEAQEEGVDGDVIQILSPRRNCKDRKSVV